MKSVSARFLSVKKENLWIRDRDRPWDRLVSYFLGICGGNFILGGLALCQGLFSCSRMGLAQPVIGNGYLYLIRRDVLGLSVTYTLSERFYRVKL